MQLLYYDGGSPTKRQLVEDVLQRFPLSYRLLDDCDISQTLGYLMEFDGYTKKEAQTSSFTADLLVMNDLDDEVIKALSTALRESNAHVERKAMLTIHNKDWTLASLLKEIVHEHAYFQSYDTLKQCIVEASTLDKEQYTQTSWQPYQQSFLDGYALLQEKEGAKERLDMMIQQIQHTKDTLQRK